MVGSAWKSTAFFLACLTVQSVFVVLTFITKDTLFVKTFGKDAIPLGTLSICALSGPVFKRCRGGAPVRMYLAFGAVFAALGGVIVGPLGDGGASAVGKVGIALLYVVSELSIGLLTAQFWDLCSRAFDVAQAKQRFGQIGLGSTLGTLFVGFYLVRTLNRAGVTTAGNLFLIAALLVFEGAMLQAGLPWVLPQGSSSSSGGGSGGGGGSSGGGGGGGKRGGSGGGGGAAGGATAGKAKAKAKAKADAKAKVKGVGAGELASSSATAAAAAAGSGGNTSGEDDDEEEEEEEAAVSVMAELCQAGGDRTAAKARRARQQAAGQDAVAASVAASPMELIRASGYFRYIVIFELCATITRQLVDFQQFTMLAAQPEETVKQTLGRISGLQSCLMMPLQFVAGLVFTRFGIMYGVATMPLAVVVFGLAVMLGSVMGGGGGGGQEAAAAAAAAAAACAAACGAGDQTTCGAACAPGGVGDAGPDWPLLLLVLASALYKAVTYTIFSTARELLWLPLSAPSRDVIKPYVNGTVRSMARIGGAAISFLLTTFLTSPVAAGLISLAMGLVWLGLCMQARAAYTSEVRPLATD